MENAILFAIVGLMFLLGVTAPNLLQSLVRPILLALAVASIALYMRWGTLPFHDGKPTPRRLVGCESSSSIRSWECCLAGLQNSEQSLSSIKRVVGVPAPSRCQQSCSTSHWHTIWTDRTLDYPCRP